MRHDRTHQQENLRVEGIEVGLMRNRRPRQPSGLLAYEYGICWALNANDGKLPIEMVYRIVFEHMKDQFTDREKRSRLDGQEPVWMYEARFARQNLVADGRMLEYKFRGIWEISKKGRDWLALFRTPPRLRQRHLFDGLRDLDETG